MAELYLQQGHVQQALEVYRRLVQRRPQDAALSERLREIEARVQPERGPMMNFREHLQAMVDSVPGALSAMIMGFDGIAIESYDRQPGVIDLPTLLIEYSSATQQLRQVAASTPDIGALTEVTITRLAGSCVLRPISEEYFLAVVLGPRALMGKARYLMRVLAPQVARELT